MSGERLWKPFRRGDLIAVFALAVILRLIMFAASNNQVGTQKVLDGCFDCTLYFNEGKAIAAGTPALFENCNFYFGPGYPLFLALNDLVFHGHIFYFIVVNIILAGLTAILIYRFAVMLSAPYSVALVASLLSATSYTSINLSCYIMSDIFFFCIFLWALILYLKGLSGGRWGWFIASAVLTGYASLTRSIGFFWPLVMIALAFAWHAVLNKNHDSPVIRHRNIIPKIASAVMIVIIITCGWMYRNYRIHGIFIPAITSATAPSFVAAITLERLTGTDANAVRQGWLSEYRAAVGKEELTLGEVSRVFSDRGYQVIDSLPWEAVKTYLTLVWGNLNEISYLHRLLLPEYNGITIPLERVVMSSPLHYLNFVLSMGGLIFLVVTRRYRTAAILGMIYLYFVLPLGFYRWQYSRHFLPGQIAWTVLDAYLLVWIGTKLGKAGRTIILQRRRAARAPENT